MEEGAGGVARAIRDVWSYEVQGVPGQGPRVGGLGGHSSGIERVACSKSHGLKSNPEPLEPGV